MNMRGAMLLSAALALAIPARAGDPMKALARRLRAELKDAPGISLCVLNFSYARGRLSTGSHLVSERLITHLVQDGAVVIERRLLNELLTEKKLMETGVAARRGAAPVRGVAGVEAIVTGTLTDLPNNETEVSARVIRADSSTVIAAARAVIPRVWMDDPRLPQPDTRSVTVPGPAPALPRNDAIPVAGGPMPPGTRYYPAPVPSFFAPAMVPIRGGNRR